VRRPQLHAALLGAAIVCGALAGEGLLVASGQPVAPSDGAFGAGARGPAEFAGHQPARPSLTVAVHRQ
jgi:hypothetical protein